MIKNKKNVFIFLNIVEAIYIFYMFNFFKTRYSVHFQWENATQQYSFLKHPIQTGKYESKICPLGNLVGYLLPIWILLRTYFYVYSHKKYRIICITNYIFWSLIFILSFLMNLNAFIYFIPAFAVETYYGVNYF